MHLVLAMPRTPIWGRAVVFATLEMRGVSEGQARVKRRNYRAKYPFDHNGLRHQCEGCEGFSRAHTKGDGVVPCPIEILFYLYVYEKTLETVETLVNLLKYNIFLPARVGHKPSLNHRKGAK
jgi:hypothetical protein